MAAVGESTHGVPAIFSFFIPGLGQLVKGHVVKGIAVWVIIGGFGFFGAAVTPLWFGIPITWVWNIYDAYRSNDRM